MNQISRNIRGTKYEDVIFAGSEARKPLGMAEVTLVLDNTDQALPLEYTEVAVTRRVYRSGESEFLINRTPVRLRDIQELFFDTGLGKEAYSVISQGRSMRFSPFVRRTGAVFLKKPLVSCGIR